MRFFDGADGLKTGFTDAAMYCMAVTARRDNMRLIAIVLGEQVSKTRNEETTELLTFGFNAYKINIIKHKADVIHTVKIEKGTVTSANAILNEDVGVLTKKSEVAINYDTEVKLSDIKLPVKKGDIIGQLLLKDGNKTIRTVDLVIDTDVDKLGYLKHIWKSFVELLSGEYL